jgi:hypothetical protein
VLVCSESHYAPMGDRRKSRFLPFNSGPLDVPAQDLGRKTAKTILEHVVVTSTPSQARGAFVQATMPSQARGGEAAGTPAAKSKRCPRCQGILKTIGIGAGGLLVGAGLTFYGGCYCMVRAFDRAWSRH